MLGALSGVGRSAAPPYTLLDDTYTTRRAPVRRAALSTVRVPWVLARSVANGCSTERSTARWAARWNTTSTSSTALVTTALSATSPSISSAPGGTFSRYPVERSSSTRVGCPSATRRSARLEPMKPAPPVTSTFMGQAATPFRSGASATTGSAYHVPWAPAAGRVTAARASRPREPGAVRRGVELRGDAQPRAAPVGGEQDLLHGGKAP